eukprot:CAMPEP_0175949600 /NCGR_PEP_ID=MMETSP0108-20121206/29123_1 /TAXON_ID=195067 ORGANISM="Goniomonas pacifica, Strain CCMP1869" /NCGR_SAMPLE_ID=MMETSP0108 /ASSEMBLY_ACC=CAM_ASM_000204 /LENGTH=42 /DNA_ID= /DNA_START= /DNA_END= /DNA_ORIENTATION=
MSITVASSGPASLPIVSPCNDSSRPTTQSRVSTPSVAAFIAS